MASYDFQSTVPYPRDTVFDWHTRPGALERLTPPWTTLRVLERTGGITDGGKVTARISIGPLPMTWVASHDEFIAGRQFRDTAVKGPFRRWVHTHRFEDVPGGTLVSDHIDYELPLAALTGPLGGGFVRNELERAFRWRHRRLREDLDAHALAGERRLRIAVTGASGLIGGQLVPFLTSAGHEVMTLVRRDPQAPGEVRWDPDRGSLDPRALEGLDAVVHLAGRNLMDQFRWTPGFKAELLRSRVESTALLVRTLLQCERAPKVLVGASAIGFYGDRGQELVSEDSPAGGGYLAGLCQAWEAACQPAREAGIRVVNLRLGVVLTPRGGALAQMLPAFRLGLGGPIGSGGQYFPWTGLDDVLGVVSRAMVDERYSGPLNLVSGDPLTSREFAATLGRVLRRPAVVPVPAAVLRMVLGESAEETILSSTGVIPQRLRELGFPFHAGSLEDHLRSELGMR